MSCIYMASIPWLGTQVLAVMVMGLGRPGQSTGPLSGTDPTVLWLQLAI